MASKVKCVKGSYRMVKRGKSGKRCVCTAKKTGMLIIRKNSSCEASEAAKKAAKKSGKKRPAPKKKACASSSLPCAHSKQIRVKGHCRCKPHANY